MCHACSVLVKHKCKYCKCHFKGASGVCLKCRNRSFEATVLTDMPKEDAGWHGVCNVCADHKRETRRLKRREFSDTNDMTPSVMWKAVSSEVRVAVELQFERLQTWLKEGKKSNQDIGVEYRKIAWHTGWIEEINGPLNKHYHNWSRRKENKYESIE